MSYKKNLLKTGCVLALFGTPFAVHAQAVTFDFTGVVTSVGGTIPGVTDGMIVTGTYTFDFANANPSLSSPPSLIGSTTLSWGALTSGGSSDQSPAPTEAVFSSTAQVGAFSYSSVQGGPYLSESYIAGLIGTSTPATYQFIGFEANQSADTYTTSILRLFDNTPPWTSDGLPVLINGQPNTGSFQSGSAGVVYDVTSLTRVPEPAAGWLLVMGLGGLVIARRRSATR
jgi:hypothetical protein